MSGQPDVPTDPGTNPSFRAPAKVAQAKHQITVLQWVIPALDGALVIVTSATPELSVAVSTVRRTGPGRCFSRRGAW